MFGFTEEEVAEQQDRGTEPEALRLDAYQRIVSRIQADTEKLWGMEAGYQIEPVVLDEEALKELLETLLDEELKKPQFVGAERIMKMLEMIPEDTLFDQMFQTLMEAQIGGLYNPSDRSLYVVDTFDPSGFLGRVILAHEITHALQDVRLGLKEFLEEEENLDRQKARQSLLEGDATMLMMEWATENMRWSALLELAGGFDMQMEGLNEAPPAVVQDLLFSYLGGMEFLLYVQMHRPNDWREFVFVNPPNSTRQILNPQEYLADPLAFPVEVEVGTLPEDEGYRELFRNTLGEWPTRLFLTPPDAFPKINLLTSIDPIVKEPIATRAAQGLAGDTIVLYEKENGGDILAWRTQWDDERRAEIFLAALKRRLRHFESFAEGEWHEKSVIGHDRAAAFRREGKVVDFILAPSKSELTRAVDLVRVPAGVGE